MARSRPGSAPPPGLRTPGRDGGSRPTAQFPRAGGWAGQMPPRTPGLPGACSAPALPTGESRASRVDQKDSFAPRIDKRCDQSACQGAPGIKQTRVRQRQAQAGAGLHQDGGEGDHQREQPAHNPAQQPDQHQGAESVGVYAAPGGVLLRQAEPLATVPPARSGLVRAAPAVRIFRTGSIRAPVLRRAARTAGAAALPPSAHR